MANYGHITKNTNPKAGTGGYKNEFLFAPLADFLVLQAPAPGGTPAIGDTLKIATAHTFTAPKGFFSYAAKIDSANGKGATVGEDGALEMEYTYEIAIVGDGAEMQEQIERLLNDDVIILFKDAECGANQYIQLGDDCVLPKIKGDFDSKTTKDGKKEWKITATCKHRYFYTATVTKAA